MSVLPGPEPGSAGNIAPSGVVTFLFSDIEGSTVRWERDRVAMQEALRRHDAVMRAAIVENGGFVFKTIGDAFCAAFNRAGEALNAVLAAQNALGAEDFSAVGGVRVRMALHSGETDERDGDYFGPAVNRVARLLAIGHGGQVLVSGMTAQLLRGLLPAEATLLDLGQHRLKDLAEPEHVSQLLAPALAAEFPPLRSLDVLANNLPASFTSFVGRESEIAEISALLEQNRLVTLAGSGGVGKTRTSLQVAANLADRFPDGVWFVELAPLADASYVSSTIAQAANLPIGSGAEPLDSLVRAIGAKSVLFVLDNCEHIVDGAARSAAALLRACANVKILASSRQPLGISGETSYRVPSLPLEAAMELFEQRARASDQRFTLTAEGARAVAEICRHLDGIPLAIELAAARVKIFSPEQIRSRLDQRFRVLTGGGRDVLPRQQTLRSLIDWSHDLLDDRERSLFRRLGIFVNGFTLEGAIAVGRGDLLDEIDVFDVLASLVDKSLVLSETEGLNVRYRLLESTRAYAIEKLDAAGEREVLAAKHLQFLLDYFAEARVRYVATMRNSELDDALAGELEDIRAALDAALDSSRRLDGANLMARIGAQWKALGLGEEGVRRAEAFIELVPETESDLLRGLWSGIARVYGFSSDGPRELAAAKKTLEYARRPGVSGEALRNALTTYASAATRTGMLDEAEAALDEAQALPGLLPLHRLSLEIDRTVLLAARGDLERAALEYDRLRRENSALGNAFNWGMACNLATVEAQRGLARRSVEILEEIMPQIRSANDRQYFEKALSLLTTCRTAARDFAGARSAAREAVEDAAARKSVSSYFLGAALEGLALCCALDGDPSDAARLKGYVDAAFDLTPDSNYDHGIGSSSLLRETLKAALAPEELERLRREGAGFTFDAAAALAFTVAS